MDSLQITFLYAADLEASQRFYEDAISLELVQVQEAGCRIYRSGPGSFLGVCKTRPDRPSGGAGVVIRQISEWVMRLISGGFLKSISPTVYFW